MFNWCAFLFIFIILVSNFEDGGEFTGGENLINFYLDIINLTVLINNLDQLGMSESLDILVGFEDLVELENLLEGLLTDLEQIVPVVI
jgi:hypothetical protein